MEEEYRMQKAAETPANASTSDDGIVIHEDGSAVPSTRRQSTISNSTTLVSKAEAQADDDASIRGVKTGSRPSTTHGSLDAGNSIPTIRISTESETHREMLEKEELDDTATNGNGEVQANGLPNAADTLEKPVQAAAEAGSEGSDAPPTPVTTSDAFSFSNKRLCERWLDNLFMVLYEVCRLFISKQSFSQRS